jgi:prepilin-type N-terminal cleavage/methylation domain-containing protein
MIHRTLPKPRGFTAVELVVVAAIFSFMMIYIISMFTAKSRESHEMMSRKDSQQSMRLLYAHLLLDVKGAMGFSVVEKNHLKLHYFKQVPGPAIDFTANLLDGKTSRTQTIEYIHKDGEVIRSVDGNVKGEYGGIEEADFSPLTVKDDSGKIILSKTDKVADAVGIYIALKAFSEDDLKHNLLQVKTKLLSETLWCIRIYGSAADGKPWFSDRGGHFSPLDRCTLF